MDMTEEIMTYLTDQRMASLGNLARHFDCTADDFIPVVEKLESAGQVRVSNSKCQSDCASCSTTCDQPTSMPKLTEQSIVISLRTRQEQL